MSRRTDSHYAKEFATFRVFGWLMAALPYRVALALGWCGAFLAFYILRYRVGEACRRMDQAFPGRFTPRQARAVAWQAWKNFIFNSIDVFRLGTIDRAWIERHVVGYEPVAERILEHCRTGKGAILASPHMGASEVTSVVMQHFGVPIFLITGTVKNPHIAKQLEILRGQTGIPTVQVGSSMLKSVIRRLNNGEVLAFLADLRARFGGTIVRFFDHPTAAAPGMAKFAKQTNVPIFPIIIRREGWTRHHLTLEEPIFPDPDLNKQDDCIRITQEVFTIVEAAIRETPEQWFWFNKRWILDPPNYEKTGRSS